MMEADRIEIASQEEKIIKAFLVCGAAISLLTLPFFVRSSMLVYQGRFLGGLSDYAIILTTAIYSPTVIYIVLKENKRAASHLWVSLVLSLSPALKEEVMRARQLKSGTGVNLHGVETNPGFIYVMKRSDGIYKIGKTTHTNRRLQQHVIDYGMKFDLVERFAVPDINLLERVALSMTARYHFDEEGRQELRFMTDAQMQKFLDQFSAICIEAISL